MISLTLDAVNASRLAEFWRLALGYEDEPPPAPHATREDWLRALGEEPGPGDDGAWLRDPTGAGPRLSILNVPEPKTAKNRLHLDLRTGGDWPAIRAEAARLTAVGATVLAEFDRHHVLLADPEGNEFCVC